MQTRGRTAWLFRDGAPDRARHPAPAPLSQVASSIADLQSSLATDQNTETYGRAQMRLHDAWGKTVLISDFPDTVNTVFLCAGISLIQTESVRCPEPRMNNSMLPLPAMVRFGTEQILTLFGLSAVLIPETHQKAPE